MLYKLAAKKSVKTLKEEAKGRAKAGAIVGLIPFGGNIAGGIEGVRNGHPVVGLLLGTPAVNGAIAKDTGVSLLDSSVQGGAQGGAAVGAALGALAGGARGGLPGAIIGGLSVGAGGALAGGTGAAALHGLGYLTGW